MNPSGPGVSDEIASALRRDNELIDLKVSRLREKVTGIQLLWAVAESLVVVFFKPLRQWWLEMERRGVVSGQRQGTQNNAIYYISAVNKPI